MAGVWSGRLLNRPFGDREPVPKVDTDVSRVGTRQCSVCSDPLDAEDADVLLAPAAAEGCESDRPVGMVSEDKGTV